jgi:hypothetical protein
MQASDAAAILSNYTKVIMTLLKYLAYAKKIVVSAYNFYFEMCILS